MVTTTTPSTLGGGNSSFLKVHCKLFVGWFVCLSLQSRIRLRSTHNIVCNTRHNFYTLAYHSISWHLQISPFTLDKLTPSYNNDLPVNFFCYFLDIPTTLQNWGGQNLIQLCTYMRSTDMYCKLCLIVLFLWHIGGFLKRPHF